MNEHLDFPIEYSFLKNRGYMFRKTLNSFCSFINQCLNQTHKNLPTSSDRGYDISWNGSVMVTDMSCHTTSQICKRGGNIGIHKSGV